MKNILDFLDLDALNNDNKILLPSNHKMHYDIEKIEVNDIVTTGGHYYSKNTINRIIDQLKKLSSFIKHKEKISNKKIASLYDIESTFTYQLLIHSLNKLTYLLEEFNKKDSKYIKNILTYKLKLKKYIHIEFIDKKKYQDLKNYTCYIKFNSDISFKREDYSNASLIEIEDMILKYKNYKKQKIEDNIIKENQMMYMNDPYILKLKVNMFKSRFDIINEMRESDWSIRWYINNLIYNTNSTSKNFYKYITRISKDEYDEYKKYQLINFKKELKMVVKIFNNQRKINEHFRDKSSEYDYTLIKQKNKKLNSEFKRVYKLISTNIGYNLISN